MPSYISVNFLFLNKPVYLEDSCTTITKYRLLQKHRLCKFVEVAVFFCMAVYITLHHF